MSVLSGQPLLKEMGGFNFIPSDLTDRYNFPFVCQCVACGVTLTLQLLVWLPWSTCDNL